jgi:hypothetical protein
VSLGITSRIAGPLTMNYHTRQDRWKSGKPASQLSVSLDSSQCSPHGL